ncbi:MAG: hypothetical protein QOI73_1514 [Solirubrobacteraceae bacterium]|jgi:hypothetical protein|nr:hypothetical protein [Solirubrobacteraceae bacterium]
MTLSILLYALMTLTVAALAGAFVVELVRERAQRTRRVRAAISVSRPERAGFRAPRVGGPSHG